MRNQSWSQQGQLVSDIELTRIAGVPTTIDHLAGTQRQATPEEESLILAEEKQLKIAAAKDRFLAAIAAQTSPPWTDIFKDLAVALELKEP